MALPDKLIIFLGRTFSGHNHDSLMLKQELPPELDWFADINPTATLESLPKIARVESRFCGRPMAGNSL